MRKQTAIRLKGEVAAFYDAVAEDFSRTRQRPWSDFEKFVPYLSKDARVLDVGCGNGRLLKWLPSESYRSYLGVDVSRELLSLARTEHRGETIHFRLGDAGALPIRDASYEAVFCIATLHHIPSRGFQLKALAECYRALSPGGYLFLTVWDLYRPTYFFRHAGALLRGQPKELFIPWATSGRHRYCHAFTMRELRGLLRDAGFEVMASWTLGRGNAGNHLVVARPFLTSRVSARTRILGVELNAVTLNEAVEAVKHFLHSGGQHAVVTPNPEILLKASEDEDYRDLLNRASLKIPDGAGLLWASSFGVGRKSRLSRLMGGLWGFFCMLALPSTARRVFPERVTGVDLISRLADQSRLMGAKIFLLGAAPGVAEEVGRRWRLAHVVGTFSGSSSPADERDIVRRVNASGANMLFVAYGAPGQEQWIARNLKKMPNVKVAIGVGGAFDFIAGVRFRAPRWMGRMGLEWLWRLAQEPRRIKRIWNATVRFPWRVVFRN